MTITALLEDQHLRGLLMGCWDFLPRESPSRCYTIRPFQSDGAIVAAGTNLDAFCTGGDGEVADYAALFTGLLRALRLAMTEAGRDKQVKWKAIYPA